MQKLYGMTDNERIAIVREVVQGKTQTEVAKKYGLSRETINRWINKHKLTERLDEHIPENQKLRGVSTLRDKAGNVVMEWVKTSPDHEKANQALLAAAEAIKKSVQPAAPIPFKIKTTVDRLASLYVVTDYHLGQLSWAGETGESWDKDIASNMLRDWIDYMVASTPNSHTGVLCNLGDFLHFDGLDAVTPTSKHVLETDTRFPELVEMATKGLRYCIDRMLQKHKHVHVVMAEGNHDLASSVWLREMFDQLYENEPRITIDKTAHPYYCFEWGNTSLFFHHSHRKKLAELDRVFASLYRDVFGRTKYSYGHTGHFHHEHTKETNLMRMRQHPTLAAKGAHDIQGGYSSMRGASVVTYCREYGFVTETFATPSMLGYKA